MFDVFKPLADCLPDRAKEFHSYFLEAALVALLSNGYAFYAPSPTLALPTKNESLPQWYARVMPAGAHDIILMANTNSALKLQLHSVLYSTILKTDPSTVINITEKQIDIALGNLQKTDSPMQHFLMGYLSSVINYATTIIHTKIVSGMWGHKVETDNVEPLVKLQIAPFVQALMQVQTFIEQTHACELRKLVVPQFWHAEDVLENPDVQTLLSRFEELKASGATEDDYAKFLIDADELAVKINLFDFAPVNLMDLLGISVTTPNDTSGKEVEAPEETVAPTETPTNDSETPTT